MYTFVYLFGGRRSEWVLLADFDFLQDFPGDFEVRQMAVFRGHGTGKVTFVDT